MAAIPARLHASPAATCTATMLRNIGEEDGIGMPRTTTPSSVMRSWLNIPPRQHSLRRAARRGGRFVCHDDGDRRGDALGCCRCCSSGHDHVDLEPDQLGHEAGKSFESPLRVSAHDDDVPALDVAELLEAFE